MWYLDVDGFYEIKQMFMHAYFGVIVLQIKLTKRISITFEKYNLLKLQISKNMFFLYYFDSFLRIRIFEIEMGT